jgi:hypothetical protein
MSDNLMVRVRNVRHVTLTDDDLRRIADWAADCAERVLPLFEAKAPSDTRPRDAIAGIRIFARGGKRTAPLRALAWAAHAAAREVSDPAATAAARAASLAAATAYTHPLATAHQGKHLLGPAVYTALACERAADDAVAARDDAIRWAIEHASPTLRKIVRRYPAQSLGRSPLAALYLRLDTGLRS